MRAETLLEMSGVEAGYGRVQVLWGVDLVVLDRETVVLLGANGAGKTTLLKTLLGLVTAWSGEIRFDGEAISGLRTDRRVRRGIVYMSETAVFPSRPSIGSTTTSRKSSRTSRPNRALRCSGSSRVEN